MPALSLLVAVVAFPPNASLGRPDEAYYGAAAWSLIHGQVMYRDVWDNKGPVIHYLLSAMTIFTGGGPRTYALLCLLLLVAAQIFLNLAFRSVGFPLAGTGAAAHQRGFRRHVGYRRPRPHRAAAPLHPSRLASPLA